MKITINLPAVCDKCETIFPSGFAGGGGATIVMIGNKSGPCPNCGSMGSVPDGTYKLTENIIEILSAPERTINELKRLSELLSKARQEKITTDELQEEVKSNTPGLTPLLDWIIPKESQQKFTFGVAILTTALNIFIPALLNKQPVHEITPDIIINHSYEINHIENNTYINQEPISDSIY